MEMVKYKDDNTSIFETIPFGNWTNLIYVEYITLH